MWAMLSLASPVTISLISFLNLAFIANSIDSDSKRLGNCSDLVRYPVVDQDEPGPKGRMDGRALEQSVAGIILMLMKCIQKFVFRLDKSFLTMTFISVFLCGVDHGSRGRSKALNCSCDVSCTVITYCDSDVLTCRFSTKSWL